MTTKNKQNNVNIAYSIRSQNKPNIETLCLDPKSHYHNVNIALCLYDDLNSKGKKEAKKIIRETVSNLELAFLKLSKGKYKIEVNNDK